MAAPRRLQPARGARPCTSSGTRTATACVGSRTALSVAELVIPYGDPGPGGYRKNAFDIGEYGLGLLTNSLELGCDCLGEIRYLDVDLATPGGEVTTIRNAICLHEEDDGILWKHYDWTTDTTEVRRSRRLVVSSIVTVGNYEYAFYWCLYQDGAIELEVKATGIILTAAAEPGETARHGDARGARLARPVPPARLLRPARPRRRRRGEHRRRGLERGAPAGDRRTRTAARFVTRETPLDERAGGAAARRPALGSLLEGRQSRASRGRSASPSATGSCPARTPRRSPSPTRASLAAPSS